MEITPLPAPSNSPPLAISTEQRILAVLCHVSVFIGVGIILPLILYIVKREDPHIKLHAGDALNFQLSFLIWSFLCVPLIFIIIGIPIFFAVIIAEFILAIIGTIKAADDQCYHYPLTIRFIK